MFPNKTKHVDGFWEITPKELQEVADQAVIIDVRRADEFKAELGHIQQAKLVTLETQFRDYLRSAPKDKEIVFVCRSGNRSGIAAGIAQAHGLMNVYNMKGGMIRWNAEKLPISKE